MPTADNRVVQMTFKNEQFEHGVKQSLHSLEELKKALDLDKSAESLSNLEKIAGSFDISGIAKGIDDIASHFTLVGNIGQEVFHRISRTAVDTMQSVIHTITSMPQAGLSKYEQKNKSIQMIQSAMPEKSIEEIEAVLAKLNDYTDLTSYDFSTMANSIGKFVSAGVDLEVAEKVMEGIANETASAGGEISQANIAMYNFSQALAAGSVKLMDWRSIQNQNLDTKEFKEQIIETAYELGTLQKVSEKVGLTAKGTLVDFQSFPQTLSEGWFTSEVMLKVFEEYADRESEVGKKGFEAAKVAITLTQAFDAVKDAISTGWMTSFGYLFGNLEEASDLFTRVSDALIGFAEQIYTTRNALLQGWHDGGEDGISGYQKVIEGLSNTWAVLMGIVEGAKGAFAEVFGALDSSGLIEASKAFAEFTGNAAKFFGFSTEEITHVEEYIEIVDGISDWTTKLQRGMRDTNSGEIQEMQQNLLNLKNDLIRLDKYGADGIFGPETERALKAFQKSVGLKETGIYDKNTRDALDKALFPNGVENVVTQETTETITHMGKGVKLLQGAFEGLTAVGKVVLGIMSTGLTMASKVIGIFKPVGLGVLYLADGLGRLISLAVDFFSSMNLGGKALAAFDRMLAPVAIVLQQVGGFFTSVGDGIRDVVRTVRMGAKNLDMIRKWFYLNPEAHKNGIMIYNVLIKLRNVAKAVTPVFESLKTTISNMFGTVKEWIGGKISAAVNSIKEFFSNLFSTANAGDILAKVLTGIGTALQVILGIVGGVGYGIYSLAKVIAEGGVALFNFVRNSEFVQNALSAISEFTKPVREFFSSVWEALTTISGKIGNLKSFSNIWRAFLNALNDNPLGKKFIPVFLKAQKAIANFRTALDGFVRTLKKVFGLLKTFNDPKAALNALILSKDNDKGAIRMLEFLVKVTDAFKSIKNVAGKVKSAVEKVFQSIFPSVKGAGKSIFDGIKNFFGGDGKSPVEKIGESFNSIKNGLGKAFENLRQWISNFVKNSPFLTELINFGKTIKNSVVEFFTMDTSEIEGLPGKLLARLKAFDPVIAWIKDKFSAVKDFLIDPKKLLSHVVGALKGIGQFIIGIFKNFNIGTIWDAAQAALGTYILLSFAGSLKSLSKSIGVLTGSIDKEEKEGLGQKLRSIAITIAIVTASLAGLALIDAGQALAGVAVMTVAIGAIGGAIIALNKFAPDTEGIGKGILNMALSIGAVVAAIGAAVLVVRNGGNLTKPLLLVGGIIVVLGGIAFLLNKFGKVYTGTTEGIAKTILAMCVGMIFIVNAVGSMAKIIKRYKPGVIVGAMVSVGIILAMLSATAILMTHFGEDGEEKSAAGVAPTILAIATAVNTIVRAIGSTIKLIKSSSTGEFIGAYAAIAVLVGGLGTMAVFLAKFSQDSTITSALSAAAPIIAMGFLIDNIVKVMANGIKSVANVDPNVIWAFMVGVDAALGIMGAVITKIVAMSAMPINLAGIAKVGLGILIILGAVGLGIGIVSSFAADAMERLSAALWITGSMMEGFSDFMANIDTASIEKVMGTLKDTILPSIATMVANSAAIAAGKELASDIRMIGVRLGLFQRSISGITMDTGAAIKKLPEDIKATIDGINAIQGIDEAKDVLLNLGGALAAYYGDLAKMTGETVTDDTGKFDITKANEAFGKLAELTLDDDTLAKIKSYATGGENDLNSFVIGIENLGTALEQYGEHISTIDPTKVETANGILDKAIDIDDHLNPVGDVNFDVLKGKKQSITDFGDDIAALGGALASYGDSVANLNSRKITMANTVIDAVSTMANKLPTIGGLSQMLTGEKKLGEFAANMSALGDGLAQYANAVSAANFTNVEASAGPLEAIARSQSILQRYGGLASLVEGTAGLDELGQGLEGLGTSLATFAKADGGIKTLKDADFEQINKALVPLTTLAKAQSQLQRMDGFFEGLSGHVDFGNLSKSLKTFGTNMVTFKDTIQGFDATDEHLTNFLDLLDRLVSMQAILNRGTTANGISALTDSFTSVIGWFSTVLGSDGDTSMIQTASDNLAGLFAQVAEAFASNDKFKTIGQNIDTSLADGINDEASKAMVVTAGDAIAQALQKIIDESAVSQSYEWGFHLVQNLSSGIQNNLGLIIAAAKAVAEAISSYLHFTVPEEEPLASVMEWMPDLSDNLASSLTDSIPGIKEAVGNYATAMKDSFAENIGTMFGGEGDAAGGFSEMLNNWLGQATNGIFSGDVESPVITPVLDMSNIEEAPSLINGYLNGQSVSVGANMAKNVLTGSGVSIIQGGTAEDHSPEIIESIHALGNEIVKVSNEVAAQMSHLKVVMNTNALVGQIAPTMDRVLGSYANRR